MNYYVPLLPPHFPTPRCIPLPLDPPCAASSACVAKHISELKPKVTSLGLNSSACRHAGACWQDHPGSTAVLVFHRSTTKATSYYNGKQLSILSLTGCILLYNYIYLSVQIYRYYHNKVINTVLLFYCHHATDASKDGWTLPCCVYAYGFKCSCPVCKIGPQ